MKFRIVSVFYLLMLSVAAISQEKYSISFIYKDMSFGEFVNEAERSLKIKIFYKDSWVKDLTMSDFPECSALPCILDNLFKPLDYHYHINTEGDIVITAGYSVSDFRNRYQITEKAEKSIIQSKQSANPVKHDSVNYYLGNYYDRFKQGKVTLSGNVVDAHSKAPVAGASVYIPGTSYGVITDHNGDFSLALPRGEYQVKCSFMGMTERNLTLHMYSSGTITISLYPNTVQLNEVLITSAKESIIERYEIGVENINTKLFNLLPTSMGEKDVIKGLMYLPGVTSVGEGSAGFNVRGGSSDQNLILLNDAPIYNSSHLFGFFSAVNSDIIKDVTLYKGGIPSRYGGRISSVLEIETKEGNKKGFRGSAGVSPITTQLLVEGPILKDTLTCLIAARTTYSDWIFGMLKDPSMQRSKASFYDFNTKLSYYPDKNNSLEFSAYHSRDYFRYAASTEYDYLNNILALKWKHRFDNGIASSVTLNNSYYRYILVNRDNPSDAYSLSHRISTTTFKSDNSYVKLKNAFNFGTEIIWNSLIPGEYFPASDSSSVRRTSIDEERAFQAALYFEDKISLTEAISISAGVRFSSFVSFGPHNVFTYSPEFTKSNLSVTDTINFRNFEPVSTYMGPEIRASVNFKISENSSFKINYNRTRQYIHLISNTTSISPTDSWKLSDYYFKPEIGDQIASGLYQILGQGKYEASAEIYYKQIQNLIDFKGGSTLTMISNMEQYMVPMKGKAYGVEIAFKKTEGKFLYNLNYTYSRSLLKSQGKFREETINSGNWYPGNFDRPDNLIITLHYLYSRRVSFTMDYIYSSGRPITYPLSTYRIRNIPLVQYSDRNIYRIPYYSRFDLSLKLSGNLRTDKIANPNLTFSVYNLTGRENAYSVFFKRENQVFKGYLLSVFGRPVPTITLNFDF